MEAGTLLFVAWLITVPCQLECMVKVNEYMTNAVPAARSVAGRHGCFNISVAAGAAEAAVTPRAGFEGVDDFQLGLQHRYQDILGQTFEWLQYERGAAAVPGRDHQLALVVGVDQPHQVAQHDAMFVAKTRARQDQAGQTRVTD